MGSDSKRLPSSEKRAKRFRDIIQAWLDGKTIECLDTRGRGTWFDVQYPSWDFLNCDYRVKRGVTYVNVYRRRATGELWFGVECESLEQCRKNREGEVTDSELLIPDLELRNE